MSHRLHRLFYSIRNVGLALIAVRAVPRTSSRSVVSGLFAVAASAVSAAALSVAALSVAALSVAALSVAVLSAVSVASVAAQQPAPREILERVDQNMTINSSKMTAEMTVTYRDGDERTMMFESWAQGTQLSFMEFTAPARDAGSRFLRRDDAMWIFLPRVGKSVRIQGHMLRQGLMGSDFSYGDASENPSMVEDYEATLEGEEELDGRPAYVLYLTANRDDLSYQHMRIWIDTERWVPLKEDMFARSGRLLKTATFSDVRQVGSRWYPFVIEMNNALQTDTRTTLTVVEMEFNIDVPSEMFTVSYLESNF